MSVSNGLILFQDSSPWWWWWRSGYSAAIRRRPDLTFCKVFWNLAIYFTCYLTCILRHFISNMCPCWPLVIGRLTVDIMSLLAYCLFHFLDSSHHLEVGKVTEKVFSFISQEKSCFTTSLCNSTLKLDLLWQLIFLTL